MHFHTEISTDKLKLKQHHSILPLNKPVLQYEALFYTYKLLSWAKHV